MDKPRTQQPGNPAWHVLASWSSRPSRCRLARSCRVAKVVGSLARRNKSPLWCLLVKVLAEAVGRRRGQPHARPASCNRRVQQIGRKDLDGYPALFLFAGCNGTCPPQPMCKGRQAGASASKHYIDRFGTTSIADLLETPDFFDLARKSYSEANAERENGRRQPLQKRPFVRKVPRRPPATLIYSFFLLAPCCQQSTV